jgi:hypothetical protein
MEGQQMVDARTIAALVGPAGAVAASSGSSSSQQPEAGGRLRTALRRQRGLAAGTGGAKQRTNILKYF